MANDLSVNYPLIMKRILPVLRENIQIARLATTIYSLERGERGTPIRINDPSAVDTYDVTPGTDITLSDVAQTKKEILTDNWKGARFKMSEKDLLEAQNGVVPSQMISAIKSIANTVDISLIQTAIDEAGNISGTASAPDSSTILSCRNKLNKTLCPMENRVMVIDPDFETTLLANQSIVASDIRGDGPSSATIRGFLARTYGVNLYMSQNLIGQGLTAGTVGSSASDSQNEAAVNGALSSGAESMAIDGATLTTGTLKKGQTFRFDSSDQDFVVLADVTLSGGAGTVTFAPKLSTAVADNVNVQFQKSYSLNGLMFDPMGIALVTRMFEPLQSGLGVIAEEAVDDVSGLTIRMKMEYDKHELFYSFDILYGKKVVRPEFICKAVTYTGTGTNPV